MAKICILLPTHWDAGKGGAEYQADLLSGYLKQATNHEVIYLAREVGDSNNQRNYSIQKIPIFIKSIRFGLFVDSIGLYKSLVNINPDVIWQRVGCAYTGVAAYYCKKNNKSLIWHIASDSDVSPMRFSFSLKKLPFIVDNFLLRYGIKNATRIVAQTKLQAESFRGNYCRSVDEIIPNFLPSEKFIKNEQGKKTQSVSVLWVSNIKKLKQPELFIKLASDFVDYSDISFSIIGRNEESKWCNNLLEEIKKIPNLEYLGEMDIEGVNRELEKADLLVNTSLYEGLPNTFIQAWMREVPTLTLNIDPDGVIRRYKLGLCAGSYKEMKDYILNIYNNIDALREVGRRAKQIANQKYSMKNADKLIGMIESEIKK